MKKIICFGIIIFVFLCACKKPVIYSDIPEIRLINFEKYQKNDDKTKITNGAILKLYFQDGEGDIGLNNNDTFPPFNYGSPYHRNLICDYYEKQNGVFIKVDSTENNNKIEYSARIPRLTNLPKESINGEITHDMLEYYANSPFDTIMLQFYILDRKLNKSNVVEVITTKGI